MCPNFACNCTFLFMEVFFHCCWCVELWSCCVSRPQRAGGGSALKLKKKDKDVDMFVDKLVQEGERVTSVTAPRQPSVTAKTTTSTPQARWTPLSPISFLPFSLPSSSICDSSSCLCACSQHTPTLWHCSLCTCLVHVCTSMTGYF